MPQVLGPAIPDDPDLVTAQLNVLPEMETLSEQHRSFILYLAGYSSTRVSESPGNVHRWMVIEEAAALPSASFLTANGEALPRMDEGFPHGIYGSLEDIKGLLRNTGIIEPVLDTWLQHAPGLKVLDNHVVQWKPSVEEQCITILAINGHPMSVEDVRERIEAASNRSYSSRSFRWRIFANPQVIRTSKTEVGLPTWGLPIYSSITGAIDETIEAGGGSAYLDDLVADLKIDRDINPTSVTAYVQQAPKYIRERRRGRASVRHRRPDEPYPVKTNMAEQRGIYQDREDTLLWRISYDENVRRGSGIPLPECVFGYFDMGPGDRGHLATSNNPVTISWSETSTHGPSIGSLQALAKTAADPGDTIFLRFSRDKTLTCLAATRLDSRADGITELGRLLAIPPAAAESSFLDMVAFRLWLPATQSDWQSIRKRLKARKEDDLVQLMPPCEVVTPALTR
tara:strand:+ start:1846 stop:3210 length:1365 start_codon:yes stop_codon:yes gene_type:complete